jgi:hypothetical protein
MNNQAKSKSSKQKNNTNPFANALAEMEKAPSSPKKTKDNAFGEALSKTGGKLGKDIDPKELQEKQLEEQQEKLKKEALRKKLHDQVNPVETTAIFDAREKQVKKEIDSLRKELKGLALDVKTFSQEIDQTLMTEVAKPGQEGTYYINFFQQLRNFIILLRQKVKSARTWARTHASKKAKQRKVKGGLDFSGKNEQKAVFDAMHNERSNAYSGG